jgi:hypothetical protein
VVKKLKQNYGCSQDMFLQPLEFLEPNSEYTKRNKKDKSNMNNVTKRYKGQNKTIHIAVYFFVSLSTFLNLVLKITGIVKTSYERLQISSNIFCHLKFSFFLIVAWFF